MTKYPIKHTMEFGEETCPSCKGNSRYMWACGHCNRSGTIPLSVTFDLVEDCPECKGKGEISSERVVTSLGTVKPSYKYPCPNCSDNGLPVGKVPRYWAPEEAAEHIKKETGIDNWDPGAVWCLRANIKVTGVLGFDLDGYSWSLSTWNERGNNYIQLLVADFGQPAPPADYRP